MHYRKIIHIDMDAFYASVEQRDHPEYRGKPVAVGHPGKRGIVSAASYEARKYGVRSAIPSEKALRLCPELIFVNPNMEKYEQVSTKIREIFRRYTDTIEPLALDEAFLDVTENTADMPFAVDIAKAIKKEIQEELELIASAGVSYNKFLAKIASDYKKPDGLYVVHPSKALNFISRLPIESFWGIGKVTAAKMHALGIDNGKQLRACSQEFLIRNFGKAGILYHNFANGIDDRPVEAERVRKSVGCEQTFEKDLPKGSALIIELYHIVRELIERLDEAGFSGRTLTLKLRFDDFTTKTHGTTPGYVLKTKNDILPLAKGLLKEVDFQEKRIRLLGLTVSNPPGEQVDDSPVQLHFNF